MEDEKSEKKFENAEASSSKPSSSVKRTPKSLKPKQKIVKNPVTKNLKKANIGNGTPQVQGSKNKKRRRKSAPQGNKESNNSAKKDDEKLNLKEEKQEMKVAITKQKHIEKDQRNRKNKEKLAESDKIQQNKKNKDKQGGSDKSLRHGKYKEKQLERIPENGKRKDKLGGIIFMCSANTKPDCFRYRVMGVSMGKKDLVLGIKPGLKLFLYDFDLKLMYGIYKASSSGGMKLEPAAFGGAFPVQVRFDVHEDCYPLPESVFKKAIRENYNERHKFKTELTVQQVKVLVDLFQPAEVHSNALHTRLPPAATTVRDREMDEGERESWHPHSHSERQIREPHVNGDTRSYPVLPCEMEHPVAYREVASSGKEELSHDSFLTEKEYRTYGLQGHRRILLPSAHVISTLEPYQSNHEREQLLRYPLPVYRETTSASGHLLVHPPPVFREPAPAQIESIRHDPLLLSEKEYQTFGLGVRREVQPPISHATASTASALDSYHKTPYYVYKYGGTSYADPYLQPVRREEVSSGSYSLDGRRGMYAVEPDHLQRNTTEQVGRSYLTSATAAVSDYNQGRVPSQGTRPEPTFAPVSSRYSFAGPSSTYR